MALICPVFAVDEAAVDETATRAATPRALAEALARLKALDVAARRSQDAVIGCDTVVEVDGATLGKPKNEAEAADMIARLSGCRHMVHTGVCLVLPQGHAPAALFSETTYLDFAPIPAAAIQQYVKTPEAYDKAGGYGIQGWAARYATRIEGCYYNVMGLPVAALYHTLLQWGILPG